MLFSLFMNSVKRHNCKSFDTFLTYNHYFIIRKWISYTSYNKIHEKGLSNYLSELYKSIENCNSGNSLFKLTHKTLTYQIHDIYIWRLIEKKFYDLQHDLTPKELSCIINYFKQIKINDSKIYDNSIDIILSTIDKYSIHDLSIICLSYTYFNKVNTIFMNKIAEQIIKLYEQEKDNIHNLTKKELKDTFISYVHIIGSYAKINHKNIEIFKIASLYIIAAFNADIKISSKMLIKIVTSYSNVKIKHTKILDLIANQVPIMKITDDELRKMKNNFDQLKYSNETFDKYIQYRLF